MALGEMNGSTGRDVLAAFVQGCEVTSKLAGLLFQDSASQGASPTGGWHFDAIAGTIGATVAAGLLLELSQEQLEQALGTAAGQASGIQANRFTAARALQCGSAAMNGIMAAEPVLGHPGSRSYPQTISLSYRQPYRHRCRAQTGSTAPNRGGPKAGHRPKPNG